MWICILSSNDWHALIIVNSGISKIRQYVPSETAIALIDTLDDYAEDITTPEMTSDLEDEMNLVKNGKKTRFPISVILDIGNPQEVKIGNDTSVIISCISIEESR